MKDYQRRVNGTREHRDTTPANEFMYGCCVVVMAIGFSIMFYYGF